MFIQIRKPLSYCTVVSIYQIKLACLVVGDIKRGTFRSAVPSRVLFPDHFGVLNQFTSFISRVVRGIPR
jgi:hypothetical protein